MALIALIVVIGLVMNGVDGSLETLLDVCPVQAVFPICTNSGGDFNKCAWANTEVCAFDTGALCWCSCCCFASEIPGALCENGSGLCVLPAPLLANSEAASSNVQVDTLSQLDRLDIGVASSVNFSAKGTPLQIHGRLSVHGNKLLDQFGQPVQLVGVSSNALQWNWGCYTKENLETLVQEWGISVFRASIVVGDGGYELDPQDANNMLYQVIDWCEELGIYVVVDWHDVTNGDPHSWVDWGDDYAEEESPDQVANVSALNYEIAAYNLQANGEVNFPSGIAMDFWIQLAQKYNTKTHILYEIASKSYGVSWSTLVAYHNALVGAIRVVDPSSIIICGTPDWNTNLVDVVAAGNNTGVYQIHNVMYAYNFWAGDGTWTDEIDASFFDIITNTSNNLPPIFVTEMATSLPSGSGGPFLAKSWFFLEGLRKLGISWTMWSFGDDIDLLSVKTSSMLTVGSCGNQTQFLNLTCTGTFAKAYISRFSNGTLPELQSLSTTTTTTPITKTKASATVSRFADDIVVVILTLPLLVIYLFRV
jgi:aryl-phospho-beta-D-glucosidase BglC (GH1 family)